jgi:hypothetical protein
MANFSLDIDSPYPAPVIENERPKRIPYPNQKIKYKHFGKIIEDLIHLAIEERDESKKHVLTLSVVNQMRKSYFIWGKEGINDEMIYNAIAEISEGRLIVSDEIKNTPIKKDNSNSSGNGTGARPKTRFVKKKK